jgi:uracil-DNA glycosylase
MLALMIAKTADVIARVRTTLTQEIGNAADAKKAGDEMEKLVEQVDTRGKGKLSQTEIKALASQNADLGAHVARAYEIITGKTIELPGSLASQLPPDWKKALKDEINKPYFKDLEKFLAADRKQFHVEPPADLVFAALKKTPLAKVKVVLLGQDPYPTAGNACGLSFSVPAGKPIPASLKNMLETAHTDVGTTMPNNGDLSAWADQGVLLLNTILTVREGAPDSHKDHGWEQFTQAILNKVNEKNDRVVFLLLGKQAQAEGALVDTSKHVVVNAPHPSPMNPGNPFGKTHVFSDVNKALTDAGRGAVDWQIPNA